MKFYKSIFSRNWWFGLALGLIIFLGSVFSPTVSGQVVDIELGDEGIVIGGGSQNSNEAIGDFCDKGYLLGVFPPWNRGLSCDKDDLKLEDEFSNRTKTKIITTNIISILTRLAGLVAVIALIVAGFKYSLSHGNSQKASGALQSIIHALAGLAVAVAATFLVEVIYGRLTNDASTTALPKVEPSLSDTIGFVMLILGLISVLMIVLQGMRYALSRGNPDKTAAARNGIIYALVGTVVALSSWSFVQFVLGRLIVPDDSVVSGTSNLLGSVIGILVFIVGVISVIMVIVGSYQYVFSGGDSQKASSARGTIIYALIGVVIAIAAGPILAWVLQRL